MTNRIADIPCETEVSELKAGWDIAGHTHMEPAGTFGTFPGGGALSEPQSMRSETGDLRRNWVEYSQAVGAYFGTAVQLAKLNARIEALEQNSSGAQIATVSPYDLKLRKPIPVVFISNGDDVLAVFFDANITASGDTIQEAFQNLRELVFETFCYLDDLPQRRLGVLPSRQLAVLREFLARKT